MNCVSTLFLKEFIYLILEREGGKEKDREKHQCAGEHQSVASCTPQPQPWPATQACALTGNQTSDLLVCRTMPSPLSHPSQG